MRIAVPADIHGNLPALEAVAGDLDRRGVDAELIARERPDWAITLSSGRMGR